jgi:hypothetical protein
MCGLYTINLSFIGQVCIRPRVILVARCLKSFSHKLSSTKTAVGGVLKPNQRKFITALTPSRQSAFSPSTTQPASLFPSRSPHLPSCKTCKSNHGRVTSDIVVELPDFRVGPFTIQGLVSLNRNQIPSSRP